MKFSVRVTAASAVVGALVLSGCGGGQESVSSGESEASGNQSVVIYSNSVNDGRGEWLTEKAKEKGFDLQIVDLGGGDVMNRLISEKNNPVADLTFGLNPVYFQKLKEADVLDSSRPVWADEVGGESIDGEGLAWPIVREPIMLVYNVAEFPSIADAPKGWEDLWEDAQFHGRYETMRSLGGATVQMVISGILVRYQDPNGKHGISDEGWQAIAEFFKNGSPQEEGIDLYARMAEGDVGIGQMWLAGKIAREEQYGVTSEAVRPEIGVPMPMQGIAVVKGAKHAEAAHEFLDWFGSAEMQAAWSNEFGTAPMNAAAAADGNQEIIAYTDSFKAQDIDWAFVAENIDSWVEEIELNYLP